MAAVTGGGEAPRPGAGVVAPTRDDPAIDAGSAAVGGPAGRRLRGHTGWWTPLRVLLALATVALALGVIERGPCREFAWERDSGQQYVHACYSDIPHLYRERGLAEGATPYLDSGEHPPLEYPVLTGAWMWATAQVTPAFAGDDVDERAVRYYDINALGLAVLGLALVAATVKLAGRRPWDAALLAASPILLLHATINWDLLAAALTAAAMLAWARRRPAWAGVWLGLAIATKLYPVVLIGALALACLRARGAVRAVALTTAVAAVTWAAVNLPVLLAAPGSWAAFYEFNSERGADFGSLWYVLEKAGHPVPALNVVSAATFLALFAGIGVLAWRAPRPPRFAQLAFLAVAAMVIAGKVWSPQFALWLLPLAVLARPRVRDLAIWQAGEVIYFFAVWYYLLGGYDRGLPIDAYNVTVLIRLGGLLWLVGVVARDILAPQHDPVRTSGAGDPAAGPLTPAPAHPPAAGPRAREPQQAAGAP